MRQVREVILWSVFLCLIVTGVSAERYYKDHAYYPPPEAPQEPAEEIPAEKSFHNDRMRMGMQRKGAPFTYSLNILQELGVTEKELAENDPPHQAAVGRRFDLEASVLFGAPAPYDGGYCFHASVRSDGAYAMRLNVDLMGLEPGEELWVFDGEGRASWGPFTSAHALPEGFWLPTSLGDQTSLVLFSPAPLLPLFRILTASHFYKDIADKAASLSCNIPIAQDGNAVVQEISSGVGLLIIPYGNGQALCSSALLNNDSMRDNMPAAYLISALHCFSDKATYSGVEVYWDYRSASADDSAKPNLYSLPKSTGTELLASNAILDAIFLNVAGAIPIGAYGRAWLGWDTEIPGKGEGVQSIHFPMGDVMKTSRGHITETEVNMCMNTFCTKGYEQQIEVLWDEGVTEQGSSGAALLSRSWNYRVIGMLSNGKTHSCEDSSRNYDNFASFSYFFPQIGCHLMSGYTCGDAYESQRSRCFLKRIFGLKGDTISYLRLFREQVLTPNPFGEKMVRDYYNAAPVLEEWLSRDRWARIAVNPILTLCAAWGAALETPDSVGQSYPHNP